jgi:DNA-binding MarR family transcriptional regulator
MSTTRQKTNENFEPIATPCLCAALRQASRAVTRIYDTELRDSGLRTTQHAVLRLLGRVGEVRQGDLGEMASLDQTTVTRNLQLLETNGLVTIREGADRREKLGKITDAGKELLEEARPAWARAQKRMQRILPDGVWDLLFAALPEVTKAASRL